MAALKNVPAGLVVYLVFLGSTISESFAVTRTAESCQYSDVLTAISAASSGDIVVIPAGHCTWTSRLTITQGIALIGAGTGQTVITNNYTCAANEYLITYLPSNFSANNSFRLSGFTFDLGNKCSCLHLNAKDSPSLVIQTRIRIDNNRFTNLATMQAITNNGMRGVVDSNTFDTIAYPIRAASSFLNGKEWWDNWPGIQYGVADNNIYFEDNIFTGVSRGIVSDCQYANRYVFRYNTIFTTVPSYPLFDMHGNQGPGFMYACFGGEIYGNRVTPSSSSFDVKLLDHRGGKALVFYNNADTSAFFGVEVREEYDDTLNPTINQPQFPTDSYYWGNRKNLTGSIAGVVTSNKIGDIPLANRDYFFQGVTFNGSSGVGCGTLAARPSTCTTGVGYWATNQSCTSLNGLVGADPATPISGTLYKCTATNTWTAYFTPLTYPHPLRVDQLNPPQNLRIVP